MDAGGAVETTNLDLIRRMRLGDETARERLVASIYERLLHLSRKMLRSGSPVVTRWEQTEDLLHAAWPRIQSALESETLAVRDEVHLFRISARHLRFALIDLYRKHAGPEGLARNHQTVRADDAQGRDANDGERFCQHDTLDPQRIAAWAEFHQVVEQLPEDQRTLVDLLWYQGLTQQQAAELLVVDVKTI